MSAEESNEINTPTYDLTAVPVIDIGSLVYKKSILYNICLKIILCLTA